MSNEIRALSVVDQAPIHASTSMKHWLETMSGNQSASFAIPWVPIGAIASVIGTSASILALLEEKDQTAYLQNISEKLNEMRSDIKDIKRDVEKILELVMQFEDLLNEQDRRNASKHLIALVELGVEKLPGWIKEMDKYGKPSQTFSNFHMNLELAIKRADDFPEDSANVSLGIALNVTIIRVLEQTELHPSTLRNHISYLRKSSQRLDEIADNYRPVGKELQNKFADARQFWGAEYSKYLSIVSNNNFPYIRSELLAQGDIEDWIEQSETGFVASTDPVILVVERKDAVGFYMPAVYENPIDQFPAKWFPDNVFYDRAKTEHTLRSRLMKLQQEYAVFRTNQEGVFSHVFGLTSISRQVEKLLDETQSLNSQLADEMV